MAWNEPGGGGKSPWGNRGNGGPPDLDEVVRKLQQRLGSLFGGGRSGGGGGARTGRFGGSFNYGLLLLVVIVLWGLSGIYVVDQAERGIVLRFGKYAATTMPGPHWHIPYPIEQVRRVNVARIRTVQFGSRSGELGSRKALMLTKDENIVDVELEVQYRVKNARAYLFNVRNPDTVLLQVAESALREVVGKSTMDFVITTGRARVVAQTEVLTQGILDHYGAGLEVTSVNMPYAQPPEQVKSAFDDAIKAREDEQRYKNEAEAYANGIIPVARGGAARLMQAAQGYKSSVVAQAEGRTSRFLQVLTEYRKAPAVTRERMYLDTMQSVLSNSTKVLLDVKGGHNVFYLPLGRSSGSRSADESAAAAAAAVVAGGATGHAADGGGSRGRDSRGRRTR
ncbi:modulator of FtsH protease HflK [bacterium BMS3Bbin12]|nr:modulator of FtsH protease HflK [bacterium BMS3Abin12]GBE47864.1 modulator of FtsH protease HflK [bacterium BMS3Bbin12]GBE50162.1 modulator of FtsH protease HflK [bacterium BMS3Bbin13]HDJ86064.1 FtsH protease activity modulator HflK [Chromatiales bacterium]HDK03498.1 FtsH protease activity modulator HflK [Gammaproteobacteria bacterium]